MPPLSRTAAQAASTRCCARSTASAALASTDEALEEGDVTGRDATGSVERASRRDAASWRSGPAADDRDQRRQHDRGVGGVDTGQFLEVARHGTRTDAGGRLGPGVDHLEP